MAADDAPDDEANLEPRWLTGDERDAWVPFAALLLMLPGAIDSQLQRDAGLTFFEYMVLVGLSAADDDGHRMSDLALITNGSMPRLSQVIGRMEARNLVARRPDPTDGRATRVVLRPEGRRQLEAAAPGHVENVRRLVFDHLTPTQVDQLRRISFKLADPLTGPDSVVQRHKRGH